MSINGNQVSLDFSRPPLSVDAGKKTERISFTASSDLKEFLYLFANKQGTEVSRLCQKYIIEGLQRDLGNMLLLSSNSNKSLLDLLNGR